MAKRAARQRKRSGVPSRFEFLQLQIEQLRDQIDSLKREDAWHIKRCAELQVEVDALKKVLNLHRA